MPVESSTAGRGKPAPIRPDWLSKTLAGLLLALAVLAVQTLNAKWEERRTLEPQFGECYAAYRAKVPHLLFAPGEAAFLLLVVLCSAAGLFF